MKVSFSGFDTPLFIDDKKVTVFEVGNRVLFARVCQSLLSCRGRQSLEPYTIWEGDEEVKASEAFLFIPNPFDLPWNDRLLMARVHLRLEKMLLEDDDLRSSLEAMGESLSSGLVSLGFQLSSDYAFGLEWDVRKYFKAFAFGIDFSEDDALLDNLIRFIDLASDASFSKVLVFINLKTFLSKKALEQLYERIVFANIRVLLLENAKDGIVDLLERKVIIDQHFLESNMHR